MNLLVMVPTRGRPVQVKRFLKSFRENTDEASVVFVIDGDDEKTYKNVDFTGAMHGVMTPRGNLVEKLNHTADAYSQAFDALMFLADDVVIQTPHWDTIMLNALEDMGGSGMLYPDDKRRSDVPEHILISSDIVRELGWFAEPSLGHYYIDNVWMELGKKASIIRWVPEVVIEHMHYSVNPATKHDKTYTETEAKYGAHDAQAYNEWRANKVQLIVSQLRGAFNPDIKWLLERV